MKNRKLYIGTYTATRRGIGGEGIYVFDLDTETGAMTLSSICKDCRNPSFLAIKGRKLYCCEEVAGEGAIASFDIDDSGALKFASRVSTEESGTCYITLWPDRAHATLANFGSSSFSGFQLDADGNPIAVTELIRHEGTGPHPRMQLKAHVHSATLYPDNMKMLICDLGNDTLTTYKLNADTGTTELIQTVSVDAGDGPRHVAFSNDGKYVTVCCQLSSVLITYKVCDNGLGDVISRVKMLPDDFNEKNDAADVHYSVDGKFIYASNRGHDSIAVFPVRDNGTLGSAKWFSSYGNSPRQFCLADSGDMAVITNQVSGNVVTVRIDSATGDITEKLCVVQVPQAVFAGIV